MAASKDARATARAAGSANLNRSGAEVSSLPLASPGPDVGADEIPFGRPVPGKPGFVFSTFGNNILDVRGIPPGTLVQDPTYPAGEKK